VIAGEDAVLTGEASVNQLEKKGYRPIKGPEGLVNAAERYGVQTPARVLSATNGMVERSRSRRRPFKPRSISSGNYSKRSA